MNRLPYLLLALVGSGFFFILTYNAGIPGSFAVVFSYVLLGAGGMWGITWRFLENRSPTESIFVSLLFAPIPLGIGAWLSSNTHWFEARYIPAMLAMLYSMWVFYSDFLRTTGIRERREFSGKLPVIYAWALGAVVLVPSLFVTISSQKIHNAATNLYNDIPWQIAMTSETLLRPAEFFPFLAGVNLSYPWSFHGFLGTLGSFSGISAATLVTEVWPILFAFLLPLFVSFYAWRLSKNRCVTLLAPIVAVFFIGPEVPFNEAIRFNLPYSISPTYEFGILALLSVLIFLSYEIPKSLSGKVSSLIIALTIVFIAAGSKGSNGLIIVAIFATYFAQAIIRNENKRFISLLTLSAAMGALGAFTMTISGDANNLNLQSLTFLAGATSLVSPVVFLMVCVVWISGIIIIIKTLESTRFSGILPSVSALLTGILCLGLFGHPGQSQIYFYWTVVPILIVLGLWAIQLLFVEFGPIAVIPLIGAWGIGQILDNQASYFFIPDVYAKLKWFVLWAILLSVVGVCYFLARKNQKLTIKMAIFLLASTAVFSLAAQPFSDVQKVFSGPAAKTAIVSISGDQMVTFNELNSKTQITDIIATNHHCLTSVPVGEECDARSTALSAFSERRVLVEGHYRTDKPEEMLRLRLNDEFIYSPTPQNFIQVWDLGVRYVYVDKMIGIPVVLSDYGTLQFETETTQIWKLHSPEQ